MCVDLKRKRIMVTGGAGFLGSFVVDRLRLEECRDVFVPRSQDDEDISSLMTKNFLIVGTKYPKQLWNEYS